MKTSTLYYQDATTHSDKVYSASVDGGVVQFAWGRRGGTMQTKTEGPMAPGAAELLWTKKLAEKRSKGYTDGEPATPLATAGFDPSTTGVAALPATPPDAVQIGQPAALALVPKPMLLNEITREQMLELARDPEWFMQEKHDGNRILLVKRGRSLTSYSRSGRETHALPKPIVQAAMACPYDFILDGEIVSDVVWTWDVLEYNGDVRHLSYSKRLSTAARMVKTFQGDGIRLVVTAKTPEEKLALVERVLAAGSLSQAVFLTVREDIERADCNMAQLQFKGEAR